MSNEAEILREENERLRLEMSRRENEREKEKALWRDKIATTITKMSGDVAQLKSAVTPLTEKVDRHDRMMTGDSQPEKGIMYRTAQLEANVKDQKAEIGAAKSLVWKAAGMALLALVKHGWDILIKGK